MFFHCGKVRETSDPPAGGGLRAEGKQNDAKKKDDAWQCGAPRPRHRLCVCIPSACANACGLRCGCRSRPHVLHASYRHRPLSSLLCSPPSRPPLHPCVCTSIFSLAPHLHSLFSSTHSSCHLKPCVLFANMVSLKCRSLYSSLPQSMSSTPKHQYVKNHNTLHIPLFGGCFNDLILSPSQPASFSPSSTSRASSVQLWWSFQFSS